VTSKYGRGRGPKPPATATAGLGSRHVHAGCGHESGRSVLFSLQCSSSSPVQTAHMTSLSRLSHPHSLFVTKSRGSPSHAGDLSDDDDATRTSEYAGQSIGLAYLWRDS
jgi:hypothetical protein